VPEWVKHVSDPALLADIRENPHRYFSVADRPSQRAFFFDPHVAVLLKGPNRAGKSLLTVVYAVCAMIGEEPFELKGMLDVRSPHTGARMIAKPPIYVRHFCVDLERSAKQVLLKHYLRWIPRRFLDTSRGENGFNQKENTLYLTQGPPCYGSGVQFLSYDVQPLKYQSAEFHIAILDEAPRQSTFEDQFPRISSIGGRLYIACTITDTASWPTDWIDKLFERGSERVKRFASVHYLDAMENYRALGKDNPRVLEDVEAMQILVRNSRLQTMLYGKSAHMGHVVYPVRNSRLQTMLYGKSAHMGHVVYPEFGEDTHGYDVAGMTPDLFMKLVRLGKGEMRCGFDYGTAAATAVVYVYVARMGIPELKLAPGDCVQIGEFYRDKSNIAGNLPGLQALQKQFTPLSYSCDPSMWRNDSVLMVSPAAMLQDVAFYKSIIAGTPLDSPVDTSLSIGPLYPAENDVEMRIEILTAMMKPRAGPASWPRYRLLVPYCRETCESLSSWSTKPDPDLLRKKPKYHEGTKHGPDAVGYFAVSPALESWRLPLRRQEERPWSPQLDPVFGVPESLAFHF